MSHRQLISQKGKEMSEIAFDRTANFTNPGSFIEPVSYLPSDVDQTPSEGMALCLSGGGYRAMMFHAGVLWRLNELGVLPQLKRISSVSGGSITAGILAKNWNKLHFTNDVSNNLKELVIDPLCGLASRTIDIPSVLSGLFWFGSIGSKVANRYRKHLFGNTTLQDIPDSPKFVFNATSVQSGVLCRFSKEYLWDYKIGKVENPEIDLATAVAASSAFPPFLSPLVLDLDPKKFIAGSGTDLEDPDYQKRLVLTDGGVYDNLGLETAWKRYTTILVSDAGGGFKREVKPKRDWLRHALRTLFTIDNQVRGLRRRQVIGSFTSKPPLKRGAFWSIGSDFSSGFKVNQSLLCPFKETSKLADISTRLAKLSPEVQRKLINWGYAACDFPLRKFLLPFADPPKEFPFAKDKV